MLVNESVQAADLAARLAHKVMRFTKTIAACAIAAAMLPALAQGGPPMVTDDPETPGDGHWEINIGAIATRTVGKRASSLRTHAAAHSNAWRRFTPRKRRANIKRCSTSDCTGSSTTR